RPQGAATLLAPAVVMVVIKAGRGTSVIATRQDRVPKASGIDVLLRNQRDRPVVRPAVRQAIRRAIRQAIRRTASRMLRMAKRSALLLDARLLKRPEQVARAPTRQAALERRPVLSAVVLSGLDSQALPRAKLGGCA